MTKEKLISLTNYANELTLKLSNPVPAKWEHAPMAYQLFLARELKLVTAKLEDAKTK